MNFSEELKSAREKAGLTLQEAADLIFIPDEEYKKWETGTNVPPEAIRYIALNRLKNPPPQKPDAQVGSIVFVTTEDITADKCEVLGEFPDYPYRLIVKSLLTGEEYNVYPEWHCFATEKDAIAASKKYREGYKDTIY